MAVASLVLGIISVICAILPGFFYIGTVVSIIGIILGVIAKKQNSENSGMASAGLTLSIIGLVFGTFFWVACTARYNSEVQAQFQLVQVLFNKK